MGDEELVSVITPMYNSSKYVGEMIQSVIDQTYRDWELIIVDDCSDDGSPHIVEKYCDMDKRIKLINQRKKGPAAARNNAIRNSKGRYIAFLDSDDLWHPDKIQIQINIMKEKSADISCTAYQMFNDTQKCIGIFNVLESITYEAMLKKNYLSCDTVMIDRNKIKEIVMDDYEKNEDYITWLRLVKKSENVCGINKVLAYYRVNNNTRSSNKIALVFPLFKIYYRIEKLGLIRSIYLVINTCVLSFIKYRR